MTSTPAYKTLADVVVPCPRVPPDERVPDVEQRFVRDGTLHAVVVETAAGPGLLTRARLNAALGGRLGFGRALLARLTVGEVVPASDVVLGPQVLLRDAAAAVLARGEETRYDDVLVLADDGAAGAASVASVFREVGLEFREIALRDPLTGLPNRRMLDERGAALLDTARERVAVLYVDLDGFKQVNDTLGHRAGDELLVEFAHRLTASVRAGDVVARLGGDEFAVLLTGATPDEAMAVADRIVSVSATPFEVDAQPVHLTATVGVALGEDVAEEPVLTLLDVLLRHADGAMLHAKHTGKARAGRLESPADAALPARRAAIRRRLGAALAEGSLTLAYQPKLDLGTDTMTSVEALVRWTDAELGPVSPAEFIPVAEHSGQVLALGRWVLATACRQVRTWLDEGRRWAVAINVSPVELAAPGLAENVLAELAVHDVPAELLQVEITESAPMADLAQARTQLAALQAAGVRVHLDDFGTGYSSLSMLRDLPVDTLKIDRSIVDRVDTHTADAQLVAGVIGAAHSLGLTVVAEGVERPAQLQRLRELGCDSAQGYLISRPGPADDVVLDRGLCPSATRPTSA